MTQSGKIARTVVEVRHKTAPKATRVTLFWLNDPKSGWLLEGLGTLQNASALAVYSRGVRTAAPSSQSLFQK